MASIHERKRGVWRITIEAGADPVTGKRKRIVRDVQGTKKAAERELARLMTERSTGDYVEPHNETVAGFLERWLAYMEPRLAPSAYASYRYVVTLRLVPELGSMGLQQLRPEHIAAAERKWLTKGRLGSKRGSRQNELSPKTVVNYHRVLREALQQAVRWRALKWNPCDSIDPPRWERTEQNSFSLVEVQRLLETLKDIKHGSALYVLVATGLRVGELLGLRWREDVDLDGHVIRVQQQYDRVPQTFRDTKTHRSRRHVTIDADLVSALRQHRVAQAERQLRAGEMWEASGLVFTDDLGRHLTHSQLRRALERALTAAGLKHIHLHGLRHTHASLLVQLGTHMKLVQERLGHASFQITADTYSHVAPGLHEQAANLLGKALRTRGERT